MKASLRDFARTGALGLIELGMSRAAVEQHLGAPEEWNATARNYRSATIWKYGDIEFYFQNDELWMIFADDFSVPTGGSKIELDAWIIRGNLCCSEAEHHLKLADIAYRKEDFPFNDNGIHLITSAGTVLAFCDEDVSQITLHSMYRKTERSC